MSKEPLKYGERAETYTGLPRELHRRSSGLDLQTLHRQANDNLVMLPAIIRAEEARREAARLQRYAERTVRARIRADIRDAKADVRRVRCGCKDCRRYVRTVSAWIGKMQDSLKEKTNA